MRLKLVNTPFIDSVETSCRHLFTGKRSDPSIATKSRIGLLLFVHKSAASFTHAHVLCADGAVGWILDQEMDIHSCERR